MKDEQIENLTEFQVRIEVEQYERLFDLIRPYANSDMAAWLVAFDFKTFFDEEARKEREAEKIKAVDRPPRKWEKAGKTQNQ